MGEGKGEVEEIRRKRRRRVCRTDQGNDNDRRENEDLKEIADASDVRRLNGNNVSDNRGNRLETHCLLIDERHEHRLDLRHREEVRQQSVKVEETREKEKERRRE